MNCIVTAGPTYEPLDDVRRLTNFSTGTLGTTLADLLAERGHNVKLLRGYYSLAADAQRVQSIESFTTTNDLHEKLRALQSAEPLAIFHAAAVSDFGFGKTFARSGNDLREVAARKIPTSGEPLLVELTPTPKILARLREWFPQALIVGWKYELDGNRETALEKGRLQIYANRTNACVVNGAAYGEGFGLVKADGSVQNLPQVAALCNALEEFARTAVL